MILFRTTPSLVHRMVTGYLLVQVLQIQILNIVLHIRNAFKSTGPFVIYILLVPDTEDTLRLAQNKEKLIKLREGIR
jgi:hypothetical protein